MCLINFKTNPNNLGQLLKDNKTLKLTDFIRCKNALFIRNSLRKENIPISNEFYSFFNQNHIHDTRGLTNYKFKLPTTGIILLNQDQSIHGICTKET